ncbi:MAG: DUF3108 domain-containing protein [Flavobacteriaceae bacterium]|nr:DUF3108 domain-containing protein [Flavobacteriaceae bacterium]
MKKLFLGLMLWISGMFSAQIKHINNGEKLTYRIHYGFINAGIAELTAMEVNYKGKPHLYVQGKGNSTGIVNTFFKVRDVYESYIDKATGLPSFYVRNISEGSYRRHFETTFNHQNKTLVLHDKLKNENRLFNTFEGIQDMLSAFYHLRNMEHSQLKVGSQIKLNVWIDDETYPFLLKVVGIEEKKTKFGKIECLKIIPSVQSGRVFKDKEGVTMWITNDKNLIPVEIKAKLLVGALKASISDYSNVKYNLEFKK